MMKWILCVFSLLIFAFNPIIFSQEAQEGSISGTVYGTDFSQTSAAINVFRIVSKDGYSIPKSECTEVVDVEGNFRCNSLPPGNYGVVLYLDRCSSLNSRAQKSCHRIVTYPLYADDDPLNLIPLQNGGTFHFYFSVDEFQPQKVLLDPVDKKRIGKLHLYWEVGGASMPIEPIDMLSSKGGNSLVLRGLPQTNIKIAENWETNGTEHEASTIVNTNGSPQIALSETPSVSIHGHLDYATPSLIPAKKLSCEDDSGTQRHHFATIIETNGSFFAESVPSGSYTCSLQGGDGFFIQRISIGMRTTNGPLLKMDNSNVPRVIVTAARSTTCITGSIQSQNMDDIHHSANIVIQNEETGIVQILKAEDGRFKILGIPPGLYRLYSWSKADTIPYKSTKYLNHFRDTSTEISVTTTTSLSNVIVVCSDCHE